jgi:hypothetical protein
MIISHDRQTLFIGVPKNGSQTARAVLGQFGVDLVGEMGRHPTVPEAIRLAEARFPGETIAPTAIYAFWRDPVERFCSAVEFHKRYLPNSFIQLFPERFADLPTHANWFETNVEAIAPELRARIDAISPTDILSALPPPTRCGAPFQFRGGNLSFYRPQSKWLEFDRITVLPFAQYELGLRQVLTTFGAAAATIPVPRINATTGNSLRFSMEDYDCINAYYDEDTIR